VFLILWIRIDSIYSVLLLVCALYRLRELQSRLNWYRGITYYCQAGLGYLQVSPDCPSESPQSALAIPMGGGGGELHNSLAATSPLSSHPPALNALPAYILLSHLYSFFLDALLAPLKRLFKSFQVALTPLGVKDVGPIGGEVYFDMSTTTG
jgi:hypothetical protein